MKRVYHADAFSFVALKLSWNTTTHPSATAAFDATTHAQGKSAAVQVSKQQKIPGRSSRHKAPIIPIPSVSKRPPYRALFWRVLALPAGLLSGDVLRAFADADIIHLQGGGEG